MRQVCSLVPYLAMKVGIFVKQDAISSRCKWSEKRPLYMTFPRLILCLVHWKARWCKYLMLLHVKVPYIHPTLHIVKLRKTILNIIFNSCHYTMWRWHASMTSRDVTWTVCGRPGKPTFVFTMSKINQVKFTYPSPRAWLSSMSPCFLLMTVRDMRS